MHEKKGCFDENVSVRLGSPGFRMTGAIRQAGPDQLAVLLPAPRSLAASFPSHGDGNKLLTSGHLFVQGVGNLKVKLHRPLEGSVKTVSVKRENEHWYVCFSVECSVQPLPESDAAVAIDVGLDAFATLESTNGEETPVENPRFYRKMMAKLRRAQRRVARRKKRSSRRRKAVVLLGKVHRQIFNQRNDYLHQAARPIVNKFGIIFVEDLNVKGLCGGMLSLSVHDAGWSYFISMLAYKAEEAGRRLVKVDARGTSQRCPCGAQVRKKLSDREHVCTACGLLTTRDRASAMEILRLGLSLQAQTKPEVKVSVA